MAFLDKLSKTISTTSKNVTKKTKDLTETAKMNSQINSEQKRIEDMHLKIGKIYYKLYRDNQHEHLIPLCSEIDDAYNKIDFCKAQIMEFKGVLPCPNCGAELPEESAFCSKCGTKIEHPEVVLQENEGEVAALKESLNCPECHCEITEDMFFCRECGTKLK